MKVSAIKRGRKFVQDGGWVDNLPIPELGDLAVLVRGAYCPQAVKLRSDLISALPEGEKPSEEDDIEIGIEVIKGAILLDWNMQEEDGSPMLCTPETIETLCKDEDIGEPLRKGIVWAANVVAERGRESLERDAKN